MKCKYTKRGEHAMNVFELLIVVAIIMILLAVFLPALRPPQRRSAKINCVNNLKQVGLAYHIWAQDNNDLYPMQVTVTNAGAMELVVTGNAVAVFQVMSNELSTPKLLICPEDLQHSFASNFIELKATNLSYFVGLDANPNNSPNLILSGDSHLGLSGAPVKSGLFKFASNAPVSWTPARHSGGGNIGLNDGSVVQTTSSGLPGCFSSAGLATDHLAIP